MVTAEARTLGALEARGNLVELSNDGPLLLKLLLLGALDRRGLVILIHVEVLACLGSHIAHAIQAKALLKFVLGKLALNLGSLVALDIIDILPERCVGILRGKVVARALKQLLLSDECDDLVVIDRQDGIVTEHLRVLFEQFLDLEEFDVSVDQELFLLIFVHVVLMEERSMVPPDKLLIDLPADLARHGNDLVIQVALLLLSDCIDSAKSFTTVHIDPNFLQSLLFFQICLPELVLLLEQVILEVVLTAMELGVLLKREGLLDHATLADFDR